MHAFALIFLPMLTHSAPRFVCDSWPTGLFIYFDASDFYLHILHSLQHLKSVIKLSWAFSRWWLNHCLHAADINESVNKFISCHSTEARATVRLCRIREMS